MWITSALSHPFPADPRDLPAPRFCQVDLLQSLQVLGIDEVMHQLGTCLGRCAMEDWLWAFEGSKKWTTTDHPFRVVLENLKRNYEIYDDDDDDDDDGLLMGY